MVHLKGKKGADPGCDKRASFGPVGGKAEFCSSHPADTMVNLHGKKRCADPGCDKRASFDQCEMFKARSDLCRRKANNAAKAIRQKLASTPEQDDRDDRWTLSSRGTSADGSLASHERLPAPPPPAVAPPSSPLPESPLTERLGLFDNFALLLGSDDGRASGVQATPMQLDNVTSGKGV